MLVFKCKDWFCSVVYILVTVFSFVWLITMSSIEYNNPFDDQACILDIMPFCLSNKNLEDLYWRNWNPLKTKTGTSIKTNVDFSRLYVLNAYSFQEVKEIIYI